MIAPCRPCKLYNNPDHRGWMEYKTPQSALVSFALVCADVLVVLLCGCSGVLCSSSLCSSV